MRTSRVAIVFKMATPLFLSHFFTRQRTCSMKRSVLYIFFSLLLMILSCKKNNTNNTNPTNPSPTSFSFSSLKVNGINSGFTYYNVNYMPSVKFSFNTELKAIITISKERIKSVFMAALTFFFSKTSSVSPSVVNVFSTSL